MTSFQQLRQIMSTPLAFDQGLGRKLLLLVGGPVLLGVILLGLFALDEYVIYPDVLPRELALYQSGLGEYDQASLMVLLHEYDQLLQTTAVVPASVRHPEGEQELELASGELGLQLSSDELLARLSERYFDATVQERFWYWLGSFGRQIDLSDYIEIDELAWETELSAIARALELPAANEGGIVFTEAGPQAVYPEPGFAIVERAARRDMIEALLLGRPAQVALSVLPDRPVTSARDIDRLQQQVAGIVSDSVEVEVPGRGVMILTPSQLQEVLVIGPDPKHGVTSLQLDEDAFARLLGADLARPRNADFVFAEDETVSVVPGKSGVELDYDGVLATLLELYRQDERAVALSVYATEPALTTERAESLGIDHLVSRFTTYHGCCADRVTNIQNMADSVDGTLVLPGEEFDLNELVGQRTEAGGFLPAGTIVRGEITDTVGGGVSQFATTLYNAVFWGGYQVVTHKPHSMYFTRYPEGIEATISWPAPDFVFRNDSDSALYVKTSYTSTSITVSLYGGNDGRMVDGRHRYGRTSIEVLDEGGSRSRVVSAKTGERRDVKPYDTQFRPDWEQVRGEFTVEDQGEEGWIVPVSRTIMVGEQVYADEQWNVRYNPRPRLIRQHPCDMTTLVASALVAVCG